MTTSRYRPPSRPASLEPALTRLRAIFPLSVEEQILVRGLGDWRSEPPGTELARGLSDSPRLLIDGWAARVRWLDDGRRQIFNFVLVGDFIGMTTRTRKIPCATVALTAVQTVDAGPLMAALRSEDTTNALGEAVARSLDLEDEEVLDQVVRLGRRSAFERTAHLILEIYRRVSLAGQAAEGRMPFPLTQEVLADATGLSVVHVNRILQQLRTEQLVDVRQGRLTLLQHDRLVEICEASQQT